MKNLRGKIFKILLITGFIILTIYLDGVILLFRNIFPRASISGIATISDRILFITFIALFWYAWETQGMRKEMVTQTEISQKPILNFLYNRKEECFKLKNDGKGIAYNIEIKKFHIKNRNFNFCFEYSNIILAPNEEKNLTTRPYISTNDFLELIRTEDYNQQYDNNFQGSKYQQPIQIKYSNSIRDAIKKEYKDIFFIIFKSIERNSKNFYIKKMI